MAHNDLKSNLDFKLNTIFEYRFLDIENKHSKLLCTEFPWVPKCKKVLLRVENPSKEDEKFFRKPENLIKALIWSF